MPDLNDCNEITMTDKKCVKVIVEPSSSMFPRIPWEYVALGAGVSVPVVGVLMFTEIEKK